MSFERDARCKHGNVTPGGTRCPECDREEELAEFEAMRAERDRFAFENAELRSQIGHLKATVQGEQAAKEEAQRKLAATTGAWEATFKTKDALALIASDDGLLRAIKNHLLTLTDEQRVEFFYAVEQGYCGSCGRKVDENEPVGCQCENDE